MAENRSLLEGKLLYVHLGIFPFDLVFPPVPVYVGNLWDVETL